MAFLAFIATSLFPEALLFVVVVVVGGGDGA